MLGRRKNVRYYFNSEYRKEWLEFCKTGIGGSDAGAICGLNPYCNAINVYRDKTSAEVEDFDNESMRQGRKEYPFMIADVDRLVVAEDAGLECKTASAYNADKWKDGAIPDHYLIQCYHYMAVTGKRSWYIAVVILGVGFRYKKIEWDDNIINNLITIEKVFWEQNVEKGVMPDPDGSKTCDEILNEYFHVAEKEQEER